MKRLALSISLIALLLVISSVGLNACQSSAPYFGIYRAGTGALVLSDRDIKTYDSTAHTFELNARGIARWNSYTDIPKLNRSLPGVDFILKIEGEEAARGQFYALLSSTSYSGLVLMQIISPFNGDAVALVLASEWPHASLGEEYAGLSAELDWVFQEHGLS